MAVNPCNPDLSGFPTNQTHTKISGLPIVYGQPRASNNSTFKVTTQVPLLGNYDESDYEYSNIYIFFSEYDYGQADTSTFTIDTLPITSTGFPGIYDEPVMNGNVMNSKLSNDGIFETLYNRSGDKYDENWNLFTGAFFPAWASAYHLCNNGGGESNFKSFATEAEFKFHNLETESGTLTVNIIHKFKLNNSSEIYYTIDNKNIYCYGGSYIPIKVDIEKSVSSTVGSITNISRSSSSGWQGMSTSYPHTLYDKYGYTLRAYFSLNNNNFINATAKISEIHEDGSIGSTISTQITNSKWVQLPNCTFTKDLDDSNGKRTESLKFQLIPGTPASSGGGGGGGGPISCLVGKKHKVMVKPNKFKKIKNLKIGDTVYTSKPDGSNWGEYKIDNLKKMDVDSYLIVKFENGAEIKCTNTHQFMSEGVKKVISNMNINDTVMLVNKTLDGVTDIKIIEILEVNKPEKCYEIDVLDADTYITENYIFQHNRKIPI